MNIVVGILATIVLISSLVYYHSKNRTVDKICSHPELSDEKVKAITDMMGKPYKIHLFFKKK